MWVYDDNVTYEIKKFEQPKTNENEIKIAFEQACLYLSKYLTIREDNLPMSGKDWKKFLLKGAKCYAINNERNDG